MEGSPEKWDVVAFRRCTIYKVDPVPASEDAVECRVEGEVWSGLGHAGTGLQVWAGG